MEVSPVTAYAEASRFLVAAVALVPPGGWEAEALGRWSTRELVGHANRGHTTVEDYLLRPQPPEPKGSLYFSDEAIAARGHEAVLLLGDEPAAAVAATSRRVIALVEATPLAAALGSPAGATTLGEYLPSRTAELTIHGLDLVRALDAELAAPQGALAESLAFVGASAARRRPGEVAEAVLFALTGRGEMPAGFSAY